MIRQYKLVIVVTDAYTGSICCSNFDTQGDLEAQTAD